MMRWYRAYEGTVSDPKLAEAALAAETSRSLAIAVWHAILESCANENNAGSFDTNPRRVAAILAEPVAVIGRVFAAFEEIGLTGDGRVTHWQERQFESDYSAERTRKYRQRKRAAKAVTSRDGDVTPPETESDTDTESERGKGGVGGKAPPRAKRAHPRTTVPNDFEPDRDYARAKGFGEQRIETMVRVFRNHHTAKGNLMANWPAAWRTWCENEMKFGGVDRAKSDLQAARDELFDNIRRELTGSQSGSGHPDGRLQALKRPQS